MTFPNVWFDSIREWASRHGLKGKDRVDDRTDQTAVEPGNDLPGEQPGGGDLLLERPSPQGGRDHGEPLRQHQAQVQRGLSPSQQADQDQPPAHCQHPEIAGQCGRSEQIDDDLDPCTRRLPADHLDEIVARGLDRHVDSERAGLLELARRPGRAKDGAAHRVGKLCRGRAHTAAHGMDEHPLSRAEPALREQAHRGP